jgi:DinB superfamily
MSAPTSLPEVWLRGPIPGVPALLQPAAHALLQVREEVARTAADATAAELWTTPGGAASAGFHLRHLAGSLDRLYTYARGEALSDGQHAALAAERTPGDPPATTPELIALVERAIDAALVQLRATPDVVLGEVRTVGRRRLPSTTLGLLFHGAEHAQRHSGQLVTTLKIVRGLRGQEPLA